MGCPDMKQPSVLSPDRTISRAKCTCDRVLTKTTLQSDTCKVCTEFSPFVTLSSLAEPKKYRHYNFITASWRNDFCWKFCHAVYQGYLVLWLWTYSFVVYNIMWGGEGAWGLETTVCLSSISLWKECRIQPPLFKGFSLGKFSTTNHAVEKVVYKLLGVYSMRKLS